MESDSPALQVNSPQIDPPHTPMHPNSAQILYYIGVPGTVIAALILSAIIFNSVGRSPIWLGILSAAALLALPLYLLIYSGGV